MARKGGADCLKHREPVVVGYKSATALVFALKLGSLLSITFQPYVSHDNEAARLPVVMAAG